MRYVILKRCYLIGGGLYNTIGSSGTIPITMGLYARNESLTNILELLRINHCQQDPYTWFLFY